MDKFISCIGGMLIASLLVGDCTAEDSRSKRGFEVEKSRDEINSLPILATIQVIGGDTKHRIDFGTHFFGNVHHGRIVVVNNSRDPVVLNRITSSCGCTFAQPVEDTLNSGSTDNVLLQVTKRHLGNYIEKIDIQLGGRVHRVEVSGKITRRLKCDGKLVFSEKESAQVSLVLDDKNLKIDEIDISVQSNLASIVKRTDGVSRIELTIARVDEVRFMESITLVPSLNNPNGHVDLLPLVVPVEFNGVVRIVPKSVFAKPDEPFRIFLFGDVDAIAKQLTSSPGVLTATFTSKDRDGRILGHTNGSVSVQKFGKSLAFTVGKKVRSALKPDAVVSVVCHGIPFSFYLRTPEQED